MRLYENLTPELQTLVPEKRKFAVTTVSARGGDIEAGSKTYAFDYVAICNGHNSLPYVPQVVGLEKFKGKVMTPKSFREPTAEFFVDKRIMVVGALYSAIDVVVQLFDNPYVGPRNFRRMILVRRDVKGVKTAEDFDRYRRSGKLDVVEGEVKEVVEPNMVRLTDGSECEVDTLIFCTGYQLNFPFLDLENDRIVDFQRNQFRGKFTAPLYKRFISIREPNLFFFGLLDYSPIGNFCNETQGLVAKARREGKFKLPSKNEMIQSFLEDIDDMQ